MVHKPIDHVYRFLIISVTKRLKMILWSSREERRALNLSRLKQAGM